MNNKLNSQLPNGGFPPIILSNKELTNNKELSNNKKSISKERLFSSNINKFNIKELVSNTIKKPLILFEEKNNIDEINSI
jgi:hypothetical protein